MARAKRFGYKAELKQFVVPRRIVKKCVDAELIPDHTPARTRSSKLPRIEERSR